MNGIDAIVSHTNIEKQKLALQYEHSYYAVYHAAIFPSKNHVQVYTGNMYVESNLNGIDAIVSCK